MLHFSDLNDRTILLEVKEEQEEILSVTLETEKSSQMEKGF